MNKRLATSLLLAIVVNAGVLLALPLLGGALEKALPAPRLLEVRDVEVTDIKEPPPAPVPRRIVREEEPAQVREEREKPENEPSPEPEKLAPRSAEPLPDLLEAIDFSLGSEALIPKIDLALPAAGAHGSNDAQSNEPEEARNILSPDEVDRLPVKIRHVQPVYPSWALEQEVESEVILSMVIGEDGRVSDVVLEESSGYGDLDRAAAAAVKRWRFAPALAGNAPVAVRAVQRIRFSMR